MNRNESFISTACKLLEKAKQQQLNQIDEMKLAHGKQTTVIFKTAKTQHLIQENQQFSQLSNVENK